MNGPDPEMLKRLRPMLPAMAKKIVADRRKREGRKIILPPGFNNGKKPDICCVCGKAFEHKLAPGQDANLLPSTCPECQKQLDDGWTAFVTEGRYAFAKHPNLPDWAGAIQIVAPSTLIKIVEGTGTESKEKENPSDETPTPEKN